MTVSLHITQPMVTGAPVRFCNRGTLYCKKQQVKSVKVCYANPSWKIYHRDTNYCH
jgi:hypothetical protein